MIGIDEIVEFTKKDYDLLLEWFHKKKCLTLPENDGYGQMLTDQGRYLYWIPGMSRVGDEKWRADTEERLRQYLAERIITKEK